MITDNNLFIHDFAITEKERNTKNGHRSLVIWMSGLSASGKSTLANQLEKVLFDASIRTMVLDGDSFRSGLNKDLDFSEAGRKENIRRVAEVSKLMANSGMVIITSFISPYREDRAQAKEIIGEDRFLELFVDTPLEVCEQRDPKGLYRKARKGEIKKFTGIDSPFESPENADIVVHNHIDSTESILKNCLNLIRQRIAL